LADRTAEVIEIEVFDRRYPLRVTSDLDRKHVMELAAEVDRRMREIATQTRTVDSLKIAILTALHLVEELRERTGGDQELEKAVRSFSRKWIREIDKVL
jgi:cell division protein ZapA